MRLRVIIFFALAAVCLLCKAQTPYFYHFTVADGLPSNKVYSITQDHRGFMWFGTDNGVVRYDGTRMVKYTVANGLPDNDAYTVFEDRHQRLWILCFKQAPCFFLNNELHTVQNDSLLKVYFENNVSYKFAVSFSLKRILFYNIKGDHTQLIEYGKEWQLPLSPTDLNNSFFRLFHSGNTDFLFVNISVVNLDNLKFQHYYRPWYQTAVEQFTRNGKEIAVICRPHIGTISFAERHGDTLREIKLIHSTQWYGAFSHKNQLYFVDSLGRVLQVDTQNLELKMTRKTVPDTRINNGFIDRAGNLWVGTSVNGLYMVPAHSTEIYETGDDKSPTCIFPYRNKIYVGTENFHVFILDPNKPIQKIDAKLLTYRTRRVSSICAKGNELYVAGDFTLGKIDLGTLKFTSYDKRYSKLQAVKDMECNTKGEILIASTLGAGIFSPELGNFSDTFWQERSTAIGSDLSDNYYIGTLNGLYKTHTRNGVVKKWITGTEIDKSRITDIKVDSKNRIWIGTAQYGLFICDGNKIRRYHDAPTANLSQKLTSYYVRNISFDNKGIAWISTDKGLNRIQSLKNGSIHILRITKAIGLPDDNFTAAYVQNDTVYLATMSGIMRFEYSNALFSEHLGCEITGAWVNFKPHALDAKFDLPYYQNNVSVEFAAIAIQSAANVGYKYRLWGSDTSWTITESNRIDLMALTPGNYRFELMAINLVTGETSEKRVLSFVIHQAWYKTTAFILSVIIFLAIIIGLLVVYRIKRLRKQSEGKIQVNKKMAELEMQALRAQMNPHFIFNALTAIQNFYVNQKEKEGNLYMARFAGLIRQSLDLSKDNMIRLEEEIQFLDNYMALEIMRFQGNLKYVCEVEESVDTESLFIPTMMLQPILENAVNHGIRPTMKPGKVQLKFYLSGDDLVCHVQDNGIGILKSEEAKLNHYSTHKSKGMFILKSRIQSIEAILQTSIRYEVTDISEISENETGTIVKIHFAKNIITEPTI